MVLNNSFKAIETTGVTSDITDEQILSNVSNTQKDVPTNLGGWKKDAKSKAIEENAKCWEELISKFSHCMKKKLSKQRRQVQAMLLMEH